MISFAIVVASMLSAACLPVESDRLLVGDLARAIPLFTNAEAARVVGYAPLPGAQRHYTIAELKSLAVSLGISGDPQEEICFTRATSVLTGDRIVEAMRRSLTDDRIQIQLIDFSRFAVPNGTLEFPSQGIVAPQKADQPAFWRGTITYGNFRRLSVWAKVILQAPCSRISAAETLPAGVPIVPTLLRVENLTGHPMHPECMSLEALVGKVPRKIITAGSVLKSSMLEPPLAVRRGETVTVESDSGGIRLRIDAIAENAGRRGDSIVVRNPGSGRKLTARVEGPGKAILQRNAGAIR